MASDINNTPECNDILGSMSRRDTVRLLGLGGLAAVAGMPQSLATAATPQASSIRETPFDDGWRFFLGDDPGASAIGFDDGSWRQVELPHDWTTEDLPGASTDDSLTADAPRWSKIAGPSRIGPFQQVMVGAGSWEDDANGVNAWVVRGVGWYRKTFAVQLSSPDQRVEIRFDGAQSNVDVYLNGVHIVFHPYGYTSFTVDLTPYLSVGGVPNVLAVRVNTSGFPSRWYAGSGIYRHVWLVQRASTSIPANGLFITTPTVSAQQAVVNVDVIIESQAGRPNTDLVLTVLDPTGKAVALIRQRVNIASGTSTTSIRAPVATPRLWDVNAPWLYQVQVALMANNQTLDAVSNTFGIRTVTIDVVNGFQLNGRTIKLEGGCVHSTNGFLGARAIDRAEIRRVEQLKAAGFNAVRTAHNPPSPAFLDACDQLGLLVYEDAFDTWDVSKMPQDYAQYFNQHSISDLTSMVVRDRNHPSVVIWSLGNEIADVGSPNGIQIGKGLYQTVKSLDPTRMVVNSGGQQFDGNLYGDDWNYVDIGDFHYNNVVYPSAHAAHPNKPLISSESYPYDFYKSWMAVKQYPYVIGEFIWTAADYLGESGIGWTDLQAPGLPLIDPRLLIPGGWGLTTYPADFFRTFPWFVSGCGDIDLVGTRRPQSYYRAVVVGRSLIEMFVMRPTPSNTVQKIGMWGWTDELQSWTWPDQVGKPLLVNVYTSGDRVDLLLNGRIVATNYLKDSDAFRTQFSVPYQQGTLKSVAYKNNSVLGEKVLATVGPAAALRLRPDRPALTASRNDLSHVVVEVVDAAGQLVPDAVVNVSFSLRGQGEISATGSGNPRNMASFVQPHHHTYQGRALAIVRPFASRGQIDLTAQSGNLQSAQLRIPVN